MSDQDTCRMPGCEAPSRSRGDFQYPDDPDKTASNGKRFRVSAYGAKFCSDYCELKFDHLKDDARDAKAAAEEEPW